MTQQDRVDVHFLQYAATILNLLAWNDFQPGKQRGGLLTAVRLDNSDDNVDALTSPGLGGGEHFVSLAYTGRGSQEDHQSAAPGAFRFSQQSVR
jgi:hypothetical protein